MAFPTGLKKAHQNGLDNDVLWPSGLEDVFYARNQAV